MKVDKLLFPETNPWIYTRQHRCQDKSLPILAWWETVKWNNNRLRVKKCGSYHCEGNDTLTCSIGLIIFHIAVGAFYL